MAAGLAVQPAGGSWGDEKPEEAKRLASAFRLYFKKRSVKLVKDLQGEYEFS